MEEKHSDGKKRKRLSKESYAYVMAPYNFVPISENTFDYTEMKKERPTHNRFRDDLYSGRISYEIVAKTSIFSGSGYQDKDEEEHLIERFYQDVHERNAISGSTIRGLSKSNAQILSFSSVSDDIDNYLLMYRNVGSGLEKDYYENVLGTALIPIDSDTTITVLKKVKAGYIERKEGKYQIYRCKESTSEERNLQCEKMNYYVVSEKAILKDYQEKEDDSSYKYLYSSAFKNEMQYKFDTTFREEDRDGKKHYVPEERWMFNGRSKGSYHPYFAAISYQLSGDKVNAIGAPKTYEKKGYLVSTGAMPEKKVVYVIPQIDMEAGTIELDSKDVVAFRRDYEGKKTTLGKGNQKYFSLPEEGETRPVFYVQVGKRTYFGYTPRLRLFYDKYVKAGLYQKETKIDYAKALFGTAKKGESFKSRVCFQDAWTESTNALEPVELILSSPKPTSCLDYLEDREEPDEFAATYNDEFCLRGIKQYWLKEEANPEQVQVVHNENEDENKASCWIRPLEAGATFQGTVTFSNLSKDELGLLLWSLELNSESEQNLGKAKALGYGRVKINVTRLSLFQNAKAYDSDKFSFEPFADGDKDEFIKYYQEFISQWLGRDIQTVKEIQDFLMMKNSQLIPSSNKTEYMKIANRDYQRRVKDVVPLPRISEVIKEQDIR